MIITTIARRATRGKRALHAVAFLFPLSILAVGPPVREPGPPFTSRLLFDAGSEGYRRYRIPALLTTSRGTLLAFCEGRKDGRGLTGNIDIVLKRSSDGGKTWGPLELVADDGPHTLGNPCPLLDQRGTLWLALTRSHGQDTEEDIVAGRSRETTRVLITSSRDDGRTWTPPRDISAARRSNWTWYGTGPGIGIQLRGGRLLFPCYHAEAKTQTYRSHMLYSDDGGKNWILGEAVGADCSECQVGERANGTLLLHARTIQGKQRRTTATSDDGGRTWSKTSHDERLYDPSCQGALLRLPADKSGSCWLVSHPAGPGRRDLTVRLSHDEGRSWPMARRVRAGDSQYSCLCLLPDGNIGCLHESWVEGNYRLYFVRFGLDWLTGT